MECECYITKHSWHNKSADVAISSLCSVESADRPSPQIIVEENVTNIENNVRKHVGVYCSVMIPFYMRPEPRLIMKVC